MRHFYVPDEKKINLNAVQQHALACQKGLYGRYEPEDCVIHMHEIISDTKCVYLSNDLPTEGHEFYKAGEDGPVRRS